MDWTGLPQRAKLFGLPENSSEFSEHEPMVRVIRVDWTGLEPVASCNQVFRTRLACCDFLRTVVLENLCAHASFECHASDLPIDLPALYEFL